VDRCRGLVRGKDLDLVEVVGYLAFLLNDEVVCFVVLALLLTCSVRPLGLLLIV
jgi:hypothetical protein